MKQIRPRDMKQAAFAAILQEHGFTACSTTAVSLAERPEETGVQFTQKARKAAQEHFKSTSEERDERPVPYGRTENRKNGRKTTVWLDDDMRDWCEMTAYLRDIPVGELIRGLIRAEMQRAASRSGQAMLVPTTGMKKTAPTAATVEAAGEKTR